jgi:RimJ/RimL family protein N-acetyltransferase
MLIPLSSEEMALLLQGMEYLERALGLASSGFTPDTHTLDAMEALYQKALSQPEDLSFLTNWQIILQEHNMFIGSVCFMGPPNEQQEVEIGYVLAPAFHGMGYMAEAVCAITDWALGQEGVLSVLAKTDTENRASGNVLRRSGFIQFFETESYNFWKKRHSE